MPVRTLKQLYQSEFSNYSLSTFQKDLVAGLNVVPVALPLSLAFAVASGASAASGLVTAILAGIIIGALAGAPYQISGPTGAMSAVLILMVHRYGLEGMWFAGVFSGILLLVIGLLRLGRFIAFIPAAVITGFTSGIALIIFIGQIDNLLGIQTPGQNSALLKLLGYFQTSFVPNWTTIGIGAMVVLLMLVWPPKWGARFPASMLGLILATGLSLFAGWQVPEIGNIPQTLLLAERFNPFAFDWSQAGELVAPTLSITVLSAIVSLLCGAVGSNMTGIRMQANQELVGQGVGNILIPFFGGIPATAAIARTNVGIKSGGVTRMVSVIHALGLLASMFLLAPIMARIPLAALAGILIVTAIRMSDWPSIRFMFQKRFKTEMITFLITVVATISLDLTQAILIGTILGAAVFLNKISSIDIQLQKVDPAKLSAKGIDCGSCEHVTVAFLTGPLFFAATGQFNEAFAHLETTHALILSMRGVSLIDPSGIESLRKLQDRLHSQNGVLMLAGVHDNVLAMMERGGLVEEIGRENIFWSSDQAIVRAEHIGCPHCEAVGGAA